MYSVSLCSVVGYLTGSFSTQFTNNFTPFFFRKVHAHGLRVGAARHYAQELEGQLQDELESVRAENGQNSGLPYRANIQQAYQTRGQACETGHVIG